MWGCYHAIKRVCSTHGSRWCGAVITWMRVSSTHGSLWCGAVIMWMRVSSTHGSRWCGAVIMWLRECHLHTAAADVGLLSCDWESVLYTRQPLMWGCYHVIERVSSKHSSRWCGVGIMWMRGCPLHTVAADVGLLSCDWESVLYTQQPLMWGWYHVNERVSSRRDFFKTAREAQLPL